MVTCQGVFFPSTVGLTPPHPFWIPAFAGMTKSVAGVCFHSNRSSRLPPAHQGMKSWSCGLVQRIGTVGFATPLLRPSGGDKPLASRSLRPRYIF